MQQGYATPVGELIFGHLVNASERFEHPTYVACVAFEGAAADKVTEMLDKLHDEAITTLKEEGKIKGKFKHKDKPYETEVTDDGKQTGRVLVKFKQRRFIPIKSSGEELEKHIAILNPDKSVYEGPNELGRGTRLQIGFTTSPSTHAVHGNGVTLRLGTVFIHDLIAQQSSSNGLAFNFEDALGGEVEPQSTNTTDVADY